MDNYSFGSKPDFYKLSLLWQLERSRIRIGAASLLTEPLTFIRDRNWHRQHHYLTEGNIRPENEAVFDFLHRKIITENIDDVRCLAERKAPMLLRRTRFCFAAYGIGSAERRAYFDNLVTDRRMRQRHLLFFDPNSGFKTALRSANPPADYLDFDDFRRAGEAFPESSLLVNNPYRAPVLDEQGAPTGSFPMHTRIANRLKFMLTAADKLYLLHSPFNSYYLILRPPAGAAERILAACRRAKLKLFRCR